MGIFDIFKKKGEKQSTNQKRAEEKRNYLNIYYHDYSLEEGIDGNHPKKVTQDSGLEYFKKLTNDRDNFIGFTDNKNKSIQFAQEEEGKWLVDIPNPPSFINFQQYADFNECIGIIKTIFQMEKVIEFPKMVKVNIMEETLDDVL